MSGQTWRQWAAQVATGMALVDADLRVRWINPALAEGLALGAHSITGQLLGLLLPDPDALAQAERAQVVVVDAPLQQLRRTTQSGQGILHFMRKAAQRSRHR